VEHKLYIDISSVELFDDLRAEMTAVKPLKWNREAKPKNIEQKIKLKQGNMETRVRGNLAAMVWKDRQRVKVLMHVFATDRG
jgi:hypothetical protein